jgi:hypothetical protein
MHRSKVCELSKHCVDAGDRLVCLADTKLQYQNNLPTAAVAIRVFLELVEKV